MHKIITYLTKKTKFHLKAHGRSMSPFIFPGDVVYIKKCKFEDITFDDLVLAKKGRKTFIHRVIYKRSTFLVTRGDNNFLSDGKILPRQIIGKIYQVKRGNKIYDPETIYLFQSTYYFQEIVKIKRVFEKEKVSFVFLKGLPLHLFFEKSHPRRLYADCDVLIAEDDYIKVKEILKKTGFQERKTALSSGHKFLKDKPTEVTFYKKLQNFPILFDIHLEVIFLMNQIGKLEVLYPQRLIDEMTQEFIKDRRIVKIQKEDFPILSANNLILYLALHFFHHNYRGMFRLHFLYRVITSSDIDWVKLGQKIKYYQLQNFLYPAFLLLNKYFLIFSEKSFLNSLKQKNSVFRFIKKNILSVNVFNEQMRIEAGKQRFIYIWRLSPKPILLKLLVVFSPQVIYSVLWLLYLKLNSFRSRLK